MSGPGRRGRILVSLCLVAVVLSGCSYARRTPTDGPAMSWGHWTVDHRDDFDGSALPTDRWARCYWWDQQGCTNLGNDEDQWYLPSQVRLADGALHLVAEPGSSTHHDRTFSYRSGMVTTGRTGTGPEPARYAFTYGYVEVRFRTPKGAGVWPAIWMLPVTNRSLPEIDLLEQYGDDTRDASMTLHTRRGREREHLRTSDLSEGWHTVGLEWTRGRLRWFLDGKERFRIEGDRVPGEPMYLLMNLAVGGSAGQPASSTDLPATFAVDRVTVWRQT